MGTILDKLNRFASRYFDIEERDEEGRVIIEGSYTEVEIEPEKPLSLKQQWTQQIISGDTSILETFLRQYRNNHQKKDKLLYLFKDNIELCQWLISLNDNDLYLRLPIEVWELVDSQIDAAGNS